MSAPRVLCKICRKKKHSEIFSECISCEASVPLTKPNLDKMNGHQIIEFYLKLSNTHTINLMRWFCLQECEDTAAGAYHAACLMLMAGYRP